MPSKRLSKVRKLIKQGLAIPINNNPFTIRLKYDTPDIVQSLTLGIDPGRENIGLCVSDENNNKIFSANVETHNKQIKQNMYSRKEHRASRRRHKRIKKQRRALKSNTTFKTGNLNTLRTKKKCFSKDISYPGMTESIIHKVCKGKEAKFNNRNKNNFITPSARNLVQIHCNLVTLIQEFLPIDKIILERNSFDFQKLENTDIKAWEYSKGPLYGFKDYKDYINTLQKGKCLLCSNSIEHYHHITYRTNNGTDNVKNIVGLCSKCHTEVHNNPLFEEELLNIKQGTIKKYSIGLLNSCMDLLIEKLNKILPISITDGKTTKETREKLKLEKDHFLDAYCISISNNDLSNILKLNTKNNYTIKHFKKKSNNIIHKLNRREYYFNNKLIAINRHKAFNQKEDSLEEYKNKFLEEKTLNEWNKHFSKLIIKPAKRTYTFHKEEIRSPFKAGDKIKYYKKNKTNGNIKQNIFVCEGLDFNNKVVCYNKTKNNKFKFCSILESKSLVFV